jgi:hypothetical protein
MVQALLRFGDSAPQFSQRESGLKKRPIFKRAASSGQGFSLSPDPLVL